MQSVSPQCTVSLEANSTLWYCDIQPTFEKIFAELQIFSQKLVGYRNCSNIQNIISKWSPRVWQQTTFLLELEYYRFNIALNKGFTTDGNSLQIVQLIKVVSATNVVVADATLIIARFVVTYHPWFHTSKEKIVLGATYFRICEQFGEQGNWFLHMWKHLFLQPWVSLRRCMEMESCNTDGKSLLIGNNQG